MIRPMTRIAVSLLFLGFGSGLIVAGSVDGRQRWTWKNTSVIKGRVKSHQPIIVRQAANGKPGEFELRITFRAKEKAEFLVVGDGDANINLYVYDKSGKLIDKDEDSLLVDGSDLCLCEWLPKKNQEYRIVLRNYSAVDSVCQAGCN